MKAWIALFRKDSLDLCVETSLLPIVLYLKFVLVVATVVGPLAK